MCAQQARKTLKIFILTQKNKLKRINRSCNRLLERLITNSLQEKKNLSLFLNHPSHCFVSMMCFVPVPLVGLAMYKVDHLASHTAKQLLPMPV